MRPFYFVATLAVFALSGWLLGPWYHHINGLLENGGNHSTSALDPAEEAVESIRSSLAEQSRGTIKVSMLSAFVVRQLTEETITDQLQLIGNHSTPDLRVYIPEGNSEPISEAYGIVLRELLVEASESADADAEIRLVLGRFVGRSKSGKRAGEDTVGNLSETIRRVLRSRLGEKTRLVQIAEALNAYEADEEHSSRIDFTPRQRTSDSVAVRAAKNGNFVLTGFRQEAKQRVSFRGTVVGPGYEYYNLSRPSWFDFELLRYAKHKSLTSTRLEEFFGRSGYLSRVPVGMVVSRPERLEINSANYAQIDALTKWSSSLYLEGSGLRLAFSSTHVTVEGNGTVCFEMTAGNREIVAVLSEEI